MTLFILQKDRGVLHLEGEAEMREFCKSCLKCGSPLTDEFPDCLGDGDYSPDGHMPACERCITHYGNKRIEALEIERGQMRWLIAAVVRGAVGAGPRGKRWEDSSCPHGMTPFYPTNAWWCDECWTALYDAVFYDKILVTRGKLMLSL